MNGFNEIKENKNKMNNSFTHLSYMYLLNTYYVPGIILGAVYMSAKTPY